MITKKIAVLFMAMMLLWGKVNAQLPDVIRWTYSVKKTSTSEALIYFKARIAKGWRIYSLHLPDGGPIKTKFAFKPSESCKLIGEPIEPTPLVRHYDVFHMDVSYFEDEVTFTQKVKFKDGKSNLAGMVTYMLESDKCCIAPEDFKFDIGL